MSFTKRIFDVKKCARAIVKHPGRLDAERNPDAYTPEELNPVLYPVYIQILREHSFSLANLDFAGIGEGDIEILENVLYYSPATRLFDISELFRQFTPSCADKRIFI